MVDLYAELREITDALEHAGIRAALVGGLAYSIYVESRATEDLDFLIFPEDWERCIAALEPLKWRALAAPMDFKNIRIRRLTKIANGDVIVCDFLLADGDHRAGVEKRNRLLVGGQPVYPAPPEAIIALKRGRMSAKDRGDIEGLEKLIHDPH